MLELIFQGFLEWAYGLALECWQYFSTALLDIMSMDFAYLKSHAPVVDEIMQILLAVGWALLIGNLVFQALKSMAVGIGFEGEDPKLLFARTFVFAFLLLASPQICEIGLSMTSKIIELLQIPDAVNVTFVDESVFGAIGAAWLLVIIFGIIVMFKVFKLLLEIAERYVILAMLTITAPLAFAMGGSKSTSEIFTGWCRMFGSMCLLMVTNVIFFKMLLSVLATVPSGLDVLPWIVLILTIVKVARKADAIVTRIGLNPAIGGITMLNKIILMGRLTRDPELRRTESGTAVCSFSIAVDRDFKSKNGEKETDFIDIVAWRATAEFVSKYFTKGRMAVVEGRLQIRDWTDKEGGKRRSAEVIADNVYFGDSKPKDGGEEDDIPAYTGAPDSFAVPDGFTPDFGGESGEMPF